LSARGYVVNPKWVRALMLRMGLQAIFPIRRVSPYMGLIRKGFFFNNEERLPQGLGYHTPYEVYFGRTASKNLLSWSI